MSHTVSLCVAHAFIIIPYTKNSVYKQQKTTKEVTMRYYIPRYRDEQAQMIVNIFNNNGYTKTIAQVLNQYSSKTSRINFISGYRNGYIQLTKKRGQHE